MFFIKGFGRLLIVLLVYLLVSPFIPIGSVSGIMVHGWLSLVLLFAARAVQRQRNQRGVAYTLLAPTLVIYWLGIFNVLSFSREVALALFVLFYALLIYAFCSQLVQIRRVTKEVIAGALCLYVIIGLFWGAMYNLTYALDSESFAGNLLESAGDQTIHCFNYFSMVTLTTLGYGDITPQTQGAAALCQMEAVVGQFFTAVLVAWLVGMYRRTEEDEADVSSS
ncbi:potassium channel family protein [Sulfuriroseicoccus oceanibius]|uniref:Two pore domain potassium channel family protein n=1 Tax=Sulfuriroseicoccus oceanibius TaxID=2707525 RepID=A0A6B3LD61_9BACT|nr:potassium channel family protein [Sulfuriroseicoccus oceanibius]QQL45408.1 two pore domain potassium channel family protein [Sulfuriroseicoccus oceanibius]